MLRSSSKESTALITGADHQLNILRSSLRMVLDDTSLLIRKGAMEQFIVESKAPIAQESLELVSHEGNLEVSQVDASRNLGLTVTIPERYCSVVASTRGAGVKVECINEGSLFINCTGSEQHAGQGDITVGSVKATTAVLMTTGAHISARKLTAEQATLSSRGGAVTVQHLIAKSANIDTSTSSAEADLADARPGAIDVTTAYANSLHLATNGGPVSCQHVDTQHGQCWVESRGGRVQMAGLDGNTDIQSRGGDVSITACDNIQALRVGSSGGNINCSVAPGALMSGAVIHARGSSIAWPAEDVGPSQRETHMRMAAAKAMQQAMQQQSGGEAAQGQQDLGNTASRAARAGEADAAAAATHRQETGSQLASEHEAGQGEGWETRRYMHGQQTGADGVDPAQCSHILLDAGQGSVDVSIMSWIATMKAKMAAGQ